MDTKSVAPKTTPRKAPRIYVVTPAERKRRKALAVAFLARFGD